MKNEIIVNLTESHEYKCNCIIIARKNENRAARFKIIVPEELRDKWLYIDFEKKSGTKIKTPKIEIVDGIGYYDVCNNLTDEVGKIKAEIIFQDETGYIWKTFIKIYQIVDSICATEEIEKENPDFISESQKVVDEAANLDIDIENSIITITKKDGSTKSENVKGETYEITDEDYKEIETNVKSDIQPILEEIENISKQAEVIARGRATGYVFDTVNDLDNWLLVEENVSKLVLGDNFYIRDIGVPDYWWDGATKQVLEVEKPDLTAYAKKEQFVTLTQTEYDALTEKSANTYYFIIEEE